MKILHIADVHLDSPLGGLSHNQALKRREEILNTFVNLIADADKGGFEVIIIAGDLFDSRFTSPSTKSAVINAFAMHQKVKVLLLSGNHDCALFDQDFVRRLPPNVFLMGEGITRLDMEDKNTTFVGADLMSVSTGQLLAIDWDPSNYNVLIAHGDKGKTSEYGAIDLDAFWDKPIDYIALGHIHSYKKEDAARGYAVYSGCLEPRGFDEDGLKGAVSIDTDILDKSKSIFFLPLASRRAFVVNLDVSNVVTSLDVVKKAAAFCDGETISEFDMVEFVLKGQIADDVVLNTGFIAEQLSKVFFYVKIKDNTSLKIDIQKIKAEFTLKSAFVREAEKTLNQDEDFLNKVLRYGINALNGEEVDSI